MLPYYKVEAGVLPQSNYHLLFLGVQGFVTALEETVSTISMNSRNNLI